MKCIFGGWGIWIFPVYNLQQSKDYIGWTAGGKREETRIKKSHKIFYELKSGDAYMGMKNNAKDWG
ncbi:hypothetical protein [Syntrophomonas curvata]